MPQPFTDASVLDHVHKLPHARATYKQLVRELRLHGENRDGLNDALDRLCDKGLLAELRSGHFVAVGENTEYVAGRLSIHRDGFGFLIPDRRKEDVFLPPGEATKGMHGDRALVHITRVGREGRAEGEILRILRRAHMTVVGEFRVKKARQLCRSFDERLRNGSRFRKAWNCRPPRSSADRVGPAPRTVKSSEDLDGMIVNVEILEFPENGEQAVGTRHRGSRFPGRIRRRCRDHDPQAPSAA